MYFPNLTTRYVFYHIITAILLCLLKPIKAQAEADCSLEGTKNAEDYAVCEGLLHRQNFTQIASEFSPMNLKGLSVSKLSEPIIAKAFYKSAAYFGLFITESAVSLRCEYGYKALSNINAFLERAVHSITGEVDNEQIGEWILRAQVFRNILTRIENCSLEGYQVEQIGNMVKEILHHQMMAYLINNSKRRLAFGKVYREINGIMSSTSDITAKISRDSTTKQIIADQVSRASPIGRTTKAVWEFAGLKGLESLNSVAKLNDKRANFFDKYPASAELIAQKEAFLATKTQNDNDGNTLSAKANKAKTLVTNLNDNTNYQKHKTHLDTQSVLINSVIIDTDTADRNIKEEMNKNPLTNQYCGNGLKIYFCK